MARKLTDDQREYLFDAAYGYLNGYNDIGEQDYPKLTVAELVEYGYDTIEFDRAQGDPTATAIYFCGKDAIMSELEKMIRTESDFAAVCIDWR